MERVMEIFRGDRLIQDFGMKLIEGREGYAKVSVVVEDRFLNAHSIGHGVLLFEIGISFFPGMAGRRGESGPRSSYWGP